MTTTTNQKSALVLAQEKAESVTLEKIEGYLDAMTASLGMHKRAKVDADHVAAANKCLDAMLALQALGLRTKYAFDERAHRWAIKEGVDAVKVAREYIMAPYLLDALPRTI